MTLIVSLSTPRFTCIILMMMAPIMAATAPQASSYLDSSLSSSYLCDKTWISSDLVVAPRASSYLLDKTWISLVSIAAFALVFITLFSAFLAAIMYNIAVFFVFGRDLLDVSHGDHVRYRALLGVLPGITSFVGRVTKFTLGVSCKNITTFILEVSCNNIATFNLGVSYNNVTTFSLVVSYTDDYSWGTPCWLVAFLMCVSARYILCFTSSSSGCAVVS